MIKNVVIKNLLINTVFRGFTILNKLVPKNDKRILLYADLGFRDNTKYLYDYLLEQNYNDEYEIVCAVNDYEKFRNYKIKNVKFTSNVKGVFKYLSSGHVFYSFGRIPIRPTNKQTVIQMWHGTSFKGFANNMKQSNSTKNQFYSYVYVSSEYFKPIVKKKFSCFSENVFLCGHPRTDVFYQSTPKYNLGKFKKTVIWLPTFRTSSKLGQSDTETNNVIPLFEVTELNQLEKYLAKKDIQLIVKLHPMQNISNVDTSRFIHLKLLTNQQFVENKFDLYRLLKQMDALITDYSSVFYDYLLLNRPIGFTEDDEDQYEKNRGFAVDDPDKFKPGMRIKTKHDLYDFLDDVLNSKDTYVAKRNEINNLANHYQDGKNCERTLTLSKIVKN